MADREDSEHAQAMRRVKTFGRRRGKTLRKGQRIALQEVLPAIAIHQDELLPSSAMDLSGFDGEVRVEIGFGGGEHLLHAAEAEPNVTFIGCEPFINGVGKLVAAIGEKNLRNIRLYTDDAMDVLRALPESSIGKVYVLYPDPWPKPRQRKRRFINEASLRQIARVLKSGGELRFATDIDDYCAWTLARVLAMGAFHWRAEDASGWLTPWPNWSGTRYESKARREGRSSAYLTFDRI